MFRPRLIPVLLLKNEGLVKSVGFKNHSYIGDPINAVKIFNDLRADELVFLDIQATKQNRCISVDFVRDVSEEANMPFAVGGGIKNLKQIQELIANGAEKVILNTSVVLNNKFVKEAVYNFGASTIVICVDIKTNWLGKQKIYIKSGTVSLKYSLVEYLKIIEDIGAGEIIIQSIDNDGKMNGFDIDLLKKVSEAVSIPVVALGGAGEINHFKDVLNKTYCSGLASGSFFVYQNRDKNVLINYPKEKIRYEKEYHI